MASRGRNKKTEESANKSGFAALAPTEDSDGAENEDPPPDASQSQLLPETMAELPWKGLSYEDYKHDLSYIVKYVAPAGFWELGNPLVGWSAEDLAQAYKDQNVTLKRGNTTAVGKIIAALIRWRIVPGTLYEHRLILDSYDKLLDELLESLQECDLQWVSDRADEPAAYWRLGVPVPVPTAPVPAPTLVPVQMPASASTKRPAITQAYTEQSSSDESPSSQGGSSDSTYINEKVAAAVHDQLIAASALPEVMSGAIGLHDAVFRQSERFGVPGQGGSETQHRLLKDMKEKASKKARAEVLKHPQKPNTARVKTRVQDGDPDHGLVREADLQRVRDMAERNLVRYITVMLMTYAGREHEVPLPILQMMSDLFLQAAEEATFGATLTPKPLTASSVFKSGIINITDATPNVIVIPRLESEIELGNFKTRKAFYRVSNKQMEGRHMDGYLSNSLIAEYTTSFKAFARECLEAHEFCEELIHDPSSCGPWSVASILPSFQRSVEEHFLATPEDDESKPLFYRSSAVSRSSTATPPPDDPSLTPATPQGSASFFGVSSSPGQASVASGRSSQGSESNRIVSLEEMREEWLLNFSGYSISNQAPFVLRNKPDMQGERAMLQTIKLKDLSWEQVLAFVLGLKRFFSTHRHAPVAWVSVIEESLIPAILARYKVVFEKGQHRTLDDITPQEMVKVLGRLCEATNWNSFSGRAQHLFAKSDLQVGVALSRQQAWPIMLRILHQLSVIIPLFGRQLGARGANLYTVQASFPVFLMQIMPKYLIEPILHNVYNPSEERREINVAHGLPATAPGLWTWSYVHEFLSLLVHEITTESDVDRFAEERTFTYHTPPAGPSPSAKFHSVLDTLSEEDEECQQIALAAIAQHRSASKAHAFGGSGSGAPSAHLQNRIQASQKQWQQQRSSETSKESMLCYRYAKDKSCPYAEKCKYKHIHDSDPSLSLEDYRLLLAHFKEQADKPPKSLHAVEAYDDVAVSDLPEIAPGMPIGKKDD